MVPRPIARRRRPALVVNSGNANAFTGAAGMAGAMAVAEAAGAVAGCPLVGSVSWLPPGVIGEPLPADKIVRVLSKVAEDASASGWPAAAEAIMTTDTYPKMATATATIDGHKVTINGIAKGSGHDRARHGDHAELRVHRCGAARRRAAGNA